MEKVNQVLRTNDYSLFKFMHENREVNRLHVERIKKSMEKKLVPSIVIVNDLYQIIDGQHSYTARKELFLPIDFMVCKGLTAKDIPSFNVERSNWNVKEYTNLYCKLGYSEYCYYKDFVSTYDLGHNVTMQLTMGSNNQDCRKMFFNGIAKFKKSKDIEKFAKMLSDYLPYTNLVKKTKIVTKLKGIFDSNWYDHAWMLKNLKTRKSELTSVKVDDGIRVLEDVYNFRIRGSRKRFY